MADAGQQGAAGRASQGSNPPASNPPASNPPGSQPPSSRRTRPSVASAQPATPSERPSTQKPPSEAPPFTPRTQGAPSTAPGSAGSLQRTPSIADTYGSYMYDLHYDDGGYHSSERDEERGQTPRAEEEERRGWCECFPATSAQGIPSMVYEKLHCVHHNVTSVTHGAVTMFSDNWIAPGKPPPIHKADFVRSRRTRTIQPQSTFISGYPPQKYGYNIPWDKEWQDFMNDQDPGSRDREDNGERPATGFQSIASARDEQSRDPLRTVSRAELTEYKETAARGSRARASDSQDVTTTRGPLTRDARTRGAVTRDARTRGDVTRDDQTRGATQQTRLPNITRQGRSQAATGSRYATVPTLPPISEPGGYDAEEQDSYREPEPELTQAEKDAAENAKYDVFKMTERVQQGKLYDPVAKKMMFYYVQPGDEQWTAHREYAQ